MKQRLVSYIKFVVFLAIGGLLLWLVLKGQDIEKVKSSIREAEYFWIGFSLLFGTASHISRAFRWNQLIYPLGYRPKAYNTFFAVMIGYFANLAFPRLGEVSKCGVLKNYEKIPISRLLGTMIIERAVDVITLLSLTALVLIIEFDLIYAFFEDKVLSGLSAQFTGSLFLLLIFMGIVIFLGILFLVFIDRIRNLAVYKKMSGIVSGIWEGVKGIRNVENKPLFIFHSIFIWGMYFMMSFVCFFAFDATDELGWRAGLSLLVLGSFGMVAPVQGGIGAYHFMASKSLEIYAVAEDSAIAFAFAVHAAQTFLIIFFGFLSLILLPVFNKKRNEPVEVGIDTQESLQPR